MLCGHLVGSVVVKTVGLSAFYSMDLFVLMLWRLLNYAIIGTLEGFILYLLFKNKYLLSYFSSASRKAHTASKTDDTNEGENGNDL